MDGCITREQFDICSKQLVDISKTVQDNFKILYSKVRMLYMLYNEYSENIQICGG